LSVMSNIVPIRMPGRSSGGTISSLCWKYRPGSMVDPAPEAVRPGGLGARRSRGLTCAPGAHSVQRRCRPRSGLGHSSDWGDPQAPQSGGVEPSARAVVGGSLAPGRAARIRPCAASRAYTPDASTPNRPPTGKVLVTSAV
jgi:hypothetical protein